MTENNISFYNEEEDAQATEISRSDQAHVPYILTAEFDVDAGPIISHTYPESIGGSVRYCFRSLALSIWANRAGSQSNVGRADVA